MKGVKKGRGKEHGVAGPVTCAQRAFL